MYANFNTYLFIIINGRSVHQIFWITCIYQFLHKWLTTDPTWFLKQWWQTNDHQFKFIQNHPIFCSNISFIFHLNDTFIVQEGKKPWKINKTIKRCICPMPRDCMQVVMLYYRPMSLLLSCTSYIEYQQS